MTSTVFHQVIYIHIYRYIYNVDETSINTLPNKTLKVLALRGKKQVGASTWAESGVLVTTETCIVPLVYSCQQCLFSS